MTMYLSRTRVPANTPAFEAYICARLRRGE